MALAACCALALTGCGSSNPKPATAPSTSVTQSASPTASPSPSAPTMPAEAKGTSPAAAKAFVRHVVAQLNYSEVTGKTQPLRRLFDPSCDGCSGIVDGLDRVRQNGGSIRTDGWRIRGIKSSPSRPGMLVVATVDVAPQVVVVKRGAKPKRFPGAKASTRRFFLEQEAGVWIVKNLDEGQ